MSQIGQTPFKTLETNIKICLKYVGPFWEVMYQRINTCSTKTGIKNHSTAHHKLQQLFFYTALHFKIFGLKISKGISFISCNVLCEKHYKKSEIFPTSFSSKHMDKSHVPAGLFLFAFLQLEY